MSRLEAPLKIPAEARKIAAEALRVRSHLPKSRQAGTSAGLATAYALVRKTDDSLTWRAIRMFWPRWAAKYTFLVTRGETAATSKIVMAGDLWGGMPMLKEVTRESQSILRDNQYANRSKRSKGDE